MKTPSKQTSSKNPVRTFEDLAVFQMARGLTKRVYEVTNAKNCSMDGGLRDQLRRAAVSIVSNIAEGYERGGNVEFIHFLSIAKGSCGEVRAQLLVACDLGFVETRITDELSTDCRRISAGLANLIKHLRESEFQGAKHNPKRTKSEFEKMLDSFVPPSASGVRALDRRQETDAPTTQPTT